jgi:hypothetical protein
MVEGGVCFFQLLIVYETSSERSGVSHGSREDACRRT